jgi:hypothetical protein
VVDTAIFLGAGASKAEGAPLQGELFRDYFSSEHFKISCDEMDRELATFFLEMFRIDVDRSDEIDKIRFPTFEEVLGLTDLAVMRKESFKNFDIENRATNSGRLRFIAQYLVFLVAKVLAAKLGNDAVHHRKLVGALRDANKLQNVVFVSTNYDILIDNALIEQRAGGDLDYGIEFRNFERAGEWERPMVNNCVRLFKPHGSLNWLFCPTCNELEITPKEKGVVTRLISDFSRSLCPDCQSVYSPLVVPPTFYKDLTNVFLSSIWNKTDVVLRKVNHIVFCGYSFPDADLHIKYLLKRAQTNRHGALEITVINDYKDKKPATRKEEEYRYKRFLGAEVNYTRKSFEEFAANPLAVLG